MPSREAEAGLTILQVLSWLNYGGVESYAIRLARALQRRGHRAIIASSGGPLLPELKAAGLEHFEVDFTGPRLLGGLMRLRRLIARERVDLVNAHNWRAGMVSYLACRAAGVPYVLTVHGTRSPMNRHGVFYWSEQVVAVSEASRRNLVEGFRLPESRVVRSFVGVDCERFSPGPAEPELEAELRLRSGAPRVVHVSRFSHSKAPVALALVEALGDLEREVPGVELVLVGQGPREAAVAAAAEEANRRLGRRAAVYLGPRADVPRILRLAGVVVGTATVALEAMASGRPVVAAGKAGYCGPVTPESVEEAESCCFADHAAPAPTTPRLLSEDLAPLLVNGRRALDLGRFGREKAVAEYSDERLAEHVEWAYRRALCNRERVRRILVLHLNQIGDLMFTLPALKALREEFPEARITSVVRPHLAGLVAHSGFVDEVVPRATGGDWRAVGLGLGMRGARPDLAIAFSQSASMVLCAWLSGARHRIGYVDSDLARLLNHRVQARGIPCPRKVMRLMRALGLAPEKTDYVGLVGLSEADREAGERLLAEACLCGDGPLIALAPGESDQRPYKSWTAHGFAEVAERLTQEEGARLVVVGAEKDRTLGHEITASVDPRRRCNLAGRTTPAQLAAVLARCDALIGIDSGPMHVAAAMGRPVVALFGPTDPDRTGPMGEGHEIIFHRQACWQPCIHPVAPACSERECMLAIQPGEVVEAARRILARSARPPGELELSRRGDGRRREGP